MRGSAVVLLVVVAGVVGCGDDDGGGSDAGGGGGVDVRYDETFDPAGCTLTACPAGKIRTACACVDPPRDGADFSANRVGCSEFAPPGGGGMRTLADDFCDEAAAGGTPDVGCFMPGMVRMPGTPRMVSLYGWVDVFGNGGDSGNITVTVYEEGADGALGRMVGTATSAIAPMGDACAKTEQEYDMDRVTGERDLGFYRIDGVPTETRLVLVTSGQADLWKDLYTYNFVILNEQLDSAAPAAGSCEAARTVTGDRYRYTAKTLSVSDWRSIPLTAGLPGGVTPGNGAVAGEIHDCDDVRVEFAQVGIRPTPVSFVYFNDDPDNPLPVTGRSEGTSRLGLYAGLDLEPGPVDVAAIGRVGTDVVSFGWYRARVFAGAVTVVTLRGLR